MDDVTICVSTFLRDECLYRCIDSIRDLHPSIPIVLSDDGHITPEKTEWLLQRDVHYITAPFDAGLSAKRNMMVDEVSTPYVVMMDDDMVLTEGANLPGLRSLMSVSDMAVAKLLYARANLEHDYLARMLIRKQLELLPLRSPWEKRGQLTWRRTHLGLNCFMAKRDLLRTIRWDRRFKTTYEHLDFFIRLRLADAYVVHTPNAMFTEYRDRPEEYKPYRTRHNEAKKIFFSKWGFSTIYKHPSFKDHRPRRRN